MLAQQDNSTTALQVFVKTAAPIVSAAQTLNFAARVILQKKNTNSTPTTQPVYRIVFQTNTEKTPLLVLVSLALLPVQLVTEEPSTTVKEQSVPLASRKPTLTLLLESSLA